MPTTRSKNKLKDTLQSSKEDKSKFAIHLNKNYFFNSKQLLKLLSPPRQSSISGSSRQELLGGGTKTRKNLNQSHELGKYVNEDLETFVDHSQRYTNNLKVLNSQTERRAVSGDRS